MHRSNSSTRCRRSDCRVLTCISHRRAERCSSNNIVFFFSVIVNTDDSQHTLRQLGAKVRNSRTTTRLEEETTSRAVVPRFLSNRKCEWQRHDELLSRHQDGTSQTPAAAELIITKQQREQTTHLAHTSVLFFIDVRCHDRRSFVVLSLLLLDESRERVPQQQQSG